MNTGFLKLLMSIKIVKALITLLILTTPLWVHALEMDIQAEFKPDSGKPHHNVFENTTPPSGYCKDNPSECQSAGMFSLQAPIQFNSTTAITPNHTDPRQGAMFNVPTEWRDLTVRHTHTGEQETVRVRIKGIGSRYKLDDVRALVPDAATYLEAHAKLWSAAWVYPPGPCSYSGIGFYGRDIYIFFWKTPTAGVCAKNARYPIPWFRYDYLDFAYEIQTPNPLNMSSGTYIGQINYTLGPRADFDLGDIMQPDDPNLTLVFNLSVLHTLKVEIPPGGNQVQLAPKGGWQQWLLTGRNVPEKLYRDQPFLISASSRFKMQLQCGLTLGDTCGLTNNRSHEVPLDIYVTLPNGLGREDGSAVNHQPLLLSGVGTDLFQPNHYVDRRQGLLHFEIQKKYISDMLLQEGKYIGNVVVIWDSEV
ncbi:hypothetical protein SB766_03070 [Pseudomonas sp. SIMBA_077]